MTPNQEMNNNIRKHFAKTTIFFASTAVLYWMTVQSAKQSKSQPRQMKLKSFKELKPTENSC
jgi:hypothetical protein